MTYYNENDPKTAAWLRELIKEGHIPAGYVDERSILDVKPHELTPYAQQHFFAGIGGWALALRLAGWPDDRAVRTGSCPCQPFSQSGKQLGTKDERHLWPVFRDLITFGETTITFGEQVASPLGREWLAGVRTDLEGLGYEVGAADLCSAGVGSPNIRQRLYWVAHSKGIKLNGTKKRRGEIQSAGKNTGASIGRGSSAGRMANADGRQSRDGGIQRSGRHGQQPENETVACGLVQPNGARRSAGQPAGAPTRYGNPAESAGSVDGLGNAHHSGSQGWNERVCGCSYQWPAGTPNLVVLCQDGKARRFEPSSFPLAHGIPGRVGLLRGYGNAIVPQVAAEFIRASEETIGGIQ